MVVVAMFNTQLAFLFTKIIFLRLIKNNLLFQATFQISKYLFHRTGLLNILCDARNMKFDTQD
jgi:hypothetical protein